MPWDIWNSKDSGAAGSSKKDLSKKVVKKLRKVADKAPKGSALKNLSNYRKSREDIMKLLD